MSRPVVVIKVGTSSLVDTKTRKVKVLSVARVADATSKLKEAGYDVVIVTSGAVGLGSVKLGLKEKPTTVAGKQAAAAVGQCGLLSLYDDVFSQLSIIIAQVLLTYDAFGDRAQYMNARNTLHALLSQSCVPIINENDTVAVQELRVGDNDTLSALVANMVSAKWLFLLTDVDCLYSCNPRADASAVPIRLVRTSQHMHNLRRQMAAGVPRLQPELTVDEVRGHGGSEGEGAVGSSSATTTAVPGVGQKAGGRSSRSPSTRTKGAAAGQSPAVPATAVPGSGQAASSGSSGGAAAVPASSGSTGSATTSVLSGAGAGSAFGTGGMETKLKAALLASAAGVTTVVMNSERIERMCALLCGAAHGEAGPTPLALALALPLPPASIPPSVPEHGSGWAHHPSLFSDACEGTTFLPAPTPVTGRKRWILSLLPQGRLVLDSGATAAVVEQRKSLYCAGVLTVSGDFTSMDAVTLVDAQGRTLAHALINYSSEEAGRLKGRHSREFADILGYQGAEALCDRDNIVLL